MKLRNFGDSLEIQNFIINMFFLKNQLLTVEGIYLKNDKVKD